MFIVNHVPLKMPDVTPDLIYLVKPFFFFKLHAMNGLDILLDWKLTHQL